VKLAPAFTAGGADDHYIRSLVRLATPFSVSGRADSLITESYL